MTSAPVRRRGRHDRGARDERPARAARDRLGRDARGRGSFGGSGRSSRLLSPARAGGLLGMLIAGLALRFATTADAFALARVDAPGLHWTSPDALDAAVGIGLGTNVFGIETKPIEDRLRRLPAVASATVRVALPGSLEVRVAERTPVLGWRVGDTTYLVDDDGNLFAVADPAAIAAVAVPVVTDAREASPIALAVGSRLDPVDLDVATRLAALVPADVGSSATRLSVRVDDTDGYVVRGTSEPWRAIFGIYLSNVRPPSLIPGQVQLLRSLLTSRETLVDRVVLADATNGTYTLRSTPHP